MSQLAGAGHHDRQRRLVGPRLERLDELPSGIVVVWVELDEAGLVVLTPDSGAGLRVDRVAVGQLVERCGQVALNLFHVRLGSLALALHSLQYGRNPVLLHLEQAQRDRPGVRAWSSLLRSPRSR